MTDQFFPKIVYKVNEGPKQWGTMHGEQFRHGIKELVEIRRELLLAKSPHLKSVLKEYALIQWEKSRAFFPAGAEELEGIALGAQLPIEDIVLLNNYTDFRDIHLPEEGCSTLYGQSGANHFAGQTWDMHGSAKNYLCLIHDQKNQHVILSLVGCLGLMGVNRHRGLIGVNNINTINAVNGLVWPILVRKALFGTTLDEMEKVLLSAPVTSGHNYLIASPEGGRHWEITPECSEKVSELHSKDKTKINDLIFHTNHCLGNNIEKLEDKNSLSSTTFCRYDLITKNKQQVKDEASLYQLLTSHEGYPKSICSHFAAKSIDPSMTCGGGLMNLDRGTGQFWRGCPTEDQHFKRYQFQLQAEGFNITA